MVPVYENEVAGAFVEEKENERIVFRVDAKNLLRYCGWCQWGDTDGFQKYLLKNDRLLMASVKDSSVLHVRQMNLKKNEWISEREYAFCGTVTDVAWIAEDELWVWVEESEKFEDLFRELKEVTGRTCFVFSWKTGSDDCRLIKDYYLGTLMSDDLQVQWEKRKLLAARVARTESEKRSRSIRQEKPNFYDRDFLLKADTEEISREIREGRADLTVTVLDQAELEGTVRLVGRDRSGLLVSRLFFLNDRRKLYRISEDGKEKKLLAEDPAKSGNYRMVPGIGCCRFQLDGENLWLQGLRSDDAWELLGKLPRDHGKLRAYADGTFWAEKNGLICEFSVEGSLIGTMEGRFCLTATGIIIF